ncbi:SMC-Scp complex subunit ScpB [Alienimonas chondri]|uniref:SMC-Scp complex subunit ScpB n=1 Tax=Alienimonas chondri TaxID=2681879 RepID=UPI0014889ABC|nr:SMC-Scp complex subunit ScpB [Alienimonas chondri]
MDRFAPRDGGLPAATAKLARLEAALMAADRPLSTRRLAEAASLIDTKEATALIEALNARNDAAGTAFRVERVARGWRLLTRRHLAPWLDRLHARPTVHSLSAPLLETLTVVAYRQPCTRADVDAVRGVQSADLLKQLLIDKKLIRTAGEEQTLGRPFLYETTPKFLETFGLRNLAELPEVEGLPRPA